MIYLIISLFFINKNNHSEKNNFLKLCFDNYEFYAIRVTENIITAFPFCLILLFHTQFILIAVVIAIAFILAITPPIKLISIPIPTPFGNHPFEFCIGFRRTILIYPIIYGCIVMSIIHNNFNLGIVMLISLFIMVMCFYSIEEKPFYLWVYSKSPLYIIFDKTITAFKYTLLLTAPAYISLAIFFSYNYILILSTLLIGFIYITTIIVTKYAAYNFQSDITKSIMYFIALIIPPPLGVLLFIHPAIKNINNIYNRQI
ncbi:MAG: hypothetical protein ACRCX1_02795 [Bacteroidales bacterium]